MLCAARKSHLPRPNRTKASSSACKNRERSVLAKGAGPPIPPSDFGPRPLRKSAMIARVAMAPPMLAAVNGLLVGEGTQSARSRLPVCRTLAHRGPLDLCVACATPRHCRRE